MYNFGAGKLIAVPTMDSLGNALTSPSPVLLGAMQDVQLDISVDMKTLYGAKRYPLAIGQGKGKIEVKAKYADINGGVLGSLFFGKTVTSGIKAAMIDFAASIPAISAYTITIAPPSTGTFVADLGVYNATSGVQMTRVASGTTPTAGQYSVVVATGVYTFAAADSGTAVKISYEYTSSTGTGAIYNITNDLMGYSPAFTLLLQNTYQGKNLVVKLNQCTSGKLALPLKNEDFTISDFDALAFSDAADNVGYICLF